jgi:single-strand DNA-binding protein
MGQDPEIRFAANGNAVANMSIATSKKYKGEEETEWHRVVCFGKLADVVREWVHKGDLIGIQGEIRTRKWQDKTGNDRYSTEIIAHRMDMLGSANRNQGAHHQGEHRDKPAQQEMHDSDGPAKQEQAPMDDGFDDIPF